MYLYADFNGAICVYIGATISRENVYHVGDIVTLHLKEINLLNCVRALA